MDANNLTVIVGEGTCGIAAGSKEVIETFQKYAPEMNIRTVGCVGMCHQEVITEVNDGNGTNIVLYPKGRQTNFPAPIFQAAPLHHCYL